MDENPAYESKTLLQRNMAYDNTSEPNYETVPSVPSQAAYMSIQQPDRERDE